MFATTSFSTQPLEVRSKPLTERGFPLAIEPTPNSATASTGAFLDWMGANRESLRNALCKHGALLFRGFSGLRTVQAFAQVVDALSPHHMDYVGGTTHRSVIQGRIVTASDPMYGGPLPIHQEMSYQASYPDHLAFFCDIPCKNGGCTPLANSRQVIERIPQRIVDEFDRRGVRTVRHYSGVRPGLISKLGKTWCEALLTQDRDEAEARMAELGWSWTWRKNGSVDVVQEPLPARRVHPRTGEKLWFNQISLNHHSRLFDEASRAGIGFLNPALKFGFRVLNQPPFPYHTQFGDGGEIPLEDVRTIRTAWRDSAVRFSWEKGDLLLVDNYLVGHGRDSYRGERRIAVALMRDALGAQA